MAKRITPTSRQIAAVKYCERILGIHFNGNSDNVLEVSNFLSKHLNRAKQVESAEMEHTQCRCCDATELDIY